MTWRKALGTSTLPLHRYAVLIYGEEDLPTFVVPFILRRRAEKHAAIARTRKGLGFAIGELIRVPFYSGPVRADVVRLADPCPADVAARLAAA